MKSARHQAILDLIEKYPIDRQEDLLAHLRQAGFEVTQATVSRDIRELRLIKTAAGDGSYRYMQATGTGKVAHSPSRFETIFGYRCGLRRPHGSGQMFFRHGQCRLRSV